MICVRETAISIQAFGVSRTDCNWVINDYLFISIMCLFLQILLVLIIVVLGKSSSDGDVVVVEVIPTSHIETFGAPRGYPTASPTYSPAVDAFCRNLTISSNSTFSACSTCILANCQYCSSGNYCFGNDDGTCKSWVYGDSSSVCNWNGNVAIIIAIIVIVIVVVCCCICGGVALLCFGVPACFASICYCCVKKVNSSSSGQAAVIPVNASYAPIPTGPTPQYNNHPYAPTQFTQPSQPYQHTPQPYNFSTQDQQGYQMTQPVGVMNTTYGSPPMPVATMIPNYPIQIGEKVV
jgi:hypothetical protein